MREADTQKLAQLPSPPPAPEVSLVDRALNSQDTYGYELGQVSSAVQGLLDFMGDIYEFSTEETEQVWYSLALHVQPWH